MQQLKQMLKIKLNAKPIQHFSLSNSVTPKSVNICLVTPMAVIEHEKVEQQDGEKDGRLGEHV